MKVDNSKETFFKHIEEFAGATHDLCNKIENKEVNVKFALETYDKIPLTEIKIYETYIR